MGVVWGAQSSVPCCVRTVMFAQCTAAGGCAGRLLCVCVGLSVCIAVCIAISASACVFVLPCECVAVCVRDRGVLRLSAALDSQQRWRCTGECVKRLRCSLMTHRAARAASAPSRRCHPMLCGIRFCRRDWVRQRRWVQWCDAMAVRVSCREMRLYQNELSGSIPSTMSNLTLLA